MGVWPQHPDLRRQHSDLRPLQSLLSFWNRSSQGCNLGRVTLGPLVGFCWVWGERRSKVGQTFPVTLEIEGIILLHSPDTCYHLILRLSDIILKWKTHFFTTAEASLPIINPLSKREKKKKTHENNEYNSKWGFSTAYCHHASGPTVINTEEQSWHEL